MSPILLILALSACAFPLSAGTGGPAVFIFGDSTVDVGTNNYIKSVFKVNHAPYGIDFPGKTATGRYSNGYNTADAVVKKFGLMNSPLPFLAIANKSSLLVGGVNFASGGSGLLDSTGASSGVVPLSKQIQQFTVVRNNLNDLLGAAKADNLVKKSFVFLSVGSNDIFQKFFLTHNVTSQDYITQLISAYEDHLQVLYALGARKFAISSVPQLGCIPVVRAGNAAGACSDELNNGAQCFYSAIGPMLQNLKSKLTQMQYALANTYKMSAVFSNPSSGLAELKNACCGGGKFNGQQLCLPNAAVCLNRDKYLYWDQYHPTQAAAAIAANTLYSGTTEFVTPINFKQLFEAPL
ncbi:hypothetical protein Scep_000198 [Stephania cephalantha]|uniref:GDSL esterase/lipase n=1 Tax=Stephania cephalantha TaxID=152367 RepID=A0AAP0Q274_9MAGN